MLTAWIRKFLMEWKIERKKKVVVGSGLFDAKFYLEKYSDVAEAGWPALDHFVRYGADENRQPSVRFDPQQYLKLNPDLATTKTPAFWHLVGGATRELPRIAGSDAISIMTELRSLKFQLLQYGVESSDATAWQSRVSSDMLALVRRQAHIEALADKITELDKRTAEIQKRIEALESMTSSVSLRNS